MPSDYTNSLPPPLVVDDFSGGITDRFLDAANHQYEKADNIIIEENKRGTTRPGTKLISETTTLNRIPGGNLRIANMINHDEEVFYYASGSLHYEDTTFKTMAGPVDSNEVFPSATSSSQISHAEWNKHRFITNDEFGSPQKLYKDSAGVWQVRNAGLPSTSFAAALAMANALKTDLNAHTQDAAEHVSAHTAVLISTANATDFPTLVALVSDMLTKYNTHDDDAELGSPVFHQATEAGDQTLTSVVAPITLAEVITRLDDLKAKYNGHDADATAHTTGSTHQNSSFSEIQLSGGAGANTYTYAFVPFYEYTIGTDTFQDFGPTVQVQIASIVTPDSTTVSITEIPEIDNGTTENWDTDNIKWYIYRTEANGSTLLFLDSIDNGTTSYSDTAADSTIANNEQIYTAGGVLDNDPPPQAKFVTVINDIAWYAHVKQGSVVRPNRVFQSAKFDPDSVPGANFIDLEDEITGIGAINIYPIVFCKNKVFRLEGFYDDQGRNGIQKREISRTIGSLNDASIVDAREGLFWAGNDGFYWTDGFRIQKISDEFDERFKDLVVSANQKKRIYGKYDKANNRIYWALTNDSGESDNNQIYVLDLKWGVKDSSTFTTISSTSWSPTSLEINDTGEFLIGDVNGYIFQFDDNKYADPKKDTTVATTSWTTSAILYDYRSVAFNFGDGMNQKWVPWLTILLENKTSISLQTLSKNEDSGAFKEMKEIRFRDNLLWKGDDVAPWKDADIRFPWKTFPLVRAKRRFPRSSIRCVYKQIQITNSFTIISRSDDLGAATVSNSANTATLAGTSANVISHSLAQIGLTLGTVTTTGILDWPTDVVDYFISFVDDSYTENFLVTSRDSAQQITFQDTGDTAPTGSNTKWVLRGTRKGERFNVISFALVWQPLSPSYGPYRGITGGNAP